MKTYLTIIYLLSSATFFANNNSKDINAEKITNQQNIEKMVTSDRNGEANNNVTMYKFAPSSKQMNETFVLQGTSDSFNKLLAVNDPSDLILKSHGNNNFYIAALHKDPIKGNANFISNKAAEKNAKLSMTFEDIDSASLVKRSQIVGKKILESPLLSLYSVHKQLMLFLANSNNSGTPPEIEAKEAKTHTVEVKSGLGLNKNYEMIDQKAEFPGGIEAFRNEIQKHINEFAVDRNEAFLKTKITFTTDVDGSMTNIKATGPDAEFNKEAERAVKAIKDKWTPRKINGQTVENEFSVPITLKFIN